jgi:hypothetical protein
MKSPFCSTVPPALGARRWRGGCGRSADRFPILLEHRGEDLQFRAQPQFQQLGLGVDEQIDERQMTKGTILAGERARLMRDSSRRLLVVRRCGLVSHHSYYTSSEEAPLSIFNSYWYIPIGRVG